MSFFKHILFKNTSIYMVATIIRSAIPFLLLPVLTRYLTPSDYGIVAIFQVVLAVFAILIGLNMQGAVSINYFKMKKSNLSKYIGNVFIILLFSFSLSLTIILLFGTYLSELILLPENWLVAVVLAALGQSIFTLALTLWQVEQKPMPYGIFQISQALVNVSLSLFFIILLGLEWEGRLLGISIASIIFGVIGIFIIVKKKYIRFSYDTKHIKDILYFGIPLIPHALGAWIITSTDRIFISSMVGIEDTGIYTVGFQVGMLIGILASAFNQAWSPFLYSKLEQNIYAIKIKIVKITYLYFIGILILTLIFSLSAPYLLKHFLGDSFSGSFEYVPWIAFGFAANGMYYMVVNYIFFIKKTYILAWVTFFSAIINIILNYYLIQLNGAIGAAQATTLTFFIAFICTWYLSYRVYPMPWRLQSQITKQEGKDS